MCEIVLNALDFAVRTCGFFLDLDIPLETSRLETFWYLPSGGPESCMQPHLDYAKPRQYCMSSLVARCTWMMLQTLTGRIWSSD